MHKFKVSKMFMKVPLDFKVRRRTVRSSICRRCLLGGLFWSPIWITIRSRSTHDERCIRNLLPTSLESSSSSALQFIELLSSRLLGDLHTKMGGEQIREIWIQPHLSSCFCTHLTFLASIFVTSTTAANLPRYKVRINFGIFFLLLKSCFHRNHSWSFLKFMDVSWIFKSKKQR